MKMRKGMSRNLISHDASIALATGGSHGKIILVLQERIGSYCDLAPILPSGIETRLPY